MLSVEEVTSAEEFMNLQTAWDTLLEENGAHSPFLTHGWFRCSLSAYGKDKELFSLIVKDGSDIVAIAPLRRYRDSSLKMPLRWISFIVIPDTPFIDFILCGQRRIEALRAILDHLYVQRRGIWDVLILSHWPSESPNYKALKKVLQEQDRRFSVNISSMTPYMLLHDNWEAFLQSRSVRFRKTYRNIENRLSRFENLEIECSQHSTDRIIKDVFVISKKSWKHKEGVSISQQQGTRKFIYALTDLAAQQGWLLIWILRVNGIPVAMEYDLKYKGKVYALRSDFDDSYSQYSPGTYLQYKILKYLSEEKYCEYSFGPGLSSYKLHWTDKYRQNMVLYAHNDNIKGRITWVLKNKCIPFFKQIRNSLRKIGHPNT